MQQILIYILIMTKEDIKQLNVLVPYCFETDQEEHWYNIGLKHEYS